MKAIVLLAAIAIYTGRITETCGFLPHIQAMFCAAHSRGN